MSHYPKYHAYFLCGNLNRRNTKISNCNVIYIYYFRIFRTHPFLEVKILSDFYLSRNFFKKRKKKTKFYSNFIEFHFVPSDTALYR